MKTIHTLAAAALTLGSLGILTTSTTTALALTEAPDGTERLKVGDTIEDFQIPTPVSPTGSESVSLSELLEDGPVVLTFFRGSWCPYCRNELSAFQDNITAFESLGASVLAVSPEVSQKTTELGDQLSTTFYIARDEDNTLAKSLNLAFKLDARTIQRYKQYGINLRESNGARTWELPVPATYVIDQERVIRFVFDDEDYSERADVKDILAIVEEAASDG